MRRSQKLSSFYWPSVVRMKPHAPKHNIKRLENIAVAHEQRLDDIEGGDA
jgi:hypothetical protein